MLFLPLLATLPLLVRGANYDTEACSKTWDDEGVTYDLSALRKEGSIRLDDISNGDEATGDFRYELDICKNVDPFPKSFNPTTKEFDGNECDSTSNGDGTTMNTDSAAFQVSQTNSFCYRLNNGFENSEMTLADPLDPAAGVSITYMGGNMCTPPRGDDLTPVPRQLKLVFLCRDDESRSMNIPDEERVREPYNTPCLYEFRIKSGYGCPTQCPVRDDRVCGGTGVCGYDVVKKTARCFCNTGFSGADCSSQASSGGASSVTIGLIIVCLLLAAVIGVLAFMYVKLRRLQLDPDSYSQLSHRFNELGQVT